MPYSSCARVYNVNVINFLSQVLCSFYYGDIWQTGKQFQRKYYSDLPLGSTLNLPFPGPCQNMGLQPSTSHERKHAQQMAE